MWVRAIYSMPFNRNTEMITVKLNEKMMNSKEPITTVIIKANNDMGRPIITARGCFYRPRSVSLNYDANEIRKDANYCSSNQHKDQHTGNTFF